MDFLDGSFKNLFLFRWKLPSTFIYLTKITKKWNLPMRIPFKNRPKRNHSKRKHYLSDIFKFIMDNLSENMPKRNYCMGNSFYEIIFQLDLGCISIFQLIITNKIWHLSLRINPYENLSKGNYSTGNIFLEIIFQLRHVRAMWKIYSSIDLPAFWFKSIFVELKLHNWENRTMKITLQVIDFKN